MRVRGISLLNRLNLALKIHRILGIVPLHLDRGRLNAGRKLVETAQLVGSVLIFVLELCGYVYKLLHRFLVNPPLPFFNSLLYNLELLLAMLNTLLAMGGCQRKRHLYEHVLHHFEVLLSDCSPNEYNRVSSWFQRLTVFAVLAMLATVVVDFLSWQNVTMSLASIFSVHIPTLITILVIVQHWYAMSFILQHCRRINGILAMLSNEPPGNNHHIRVKRLERLRAQHKDLHELVLYVNDGFGKLLLSTLAAIVVVLNVECLELYQYCRHGALSVAVSAHILYAIIWLILHSGLLFMIVYPSHWIEYERRRTGLILFELLGDMSSVDSETVHNFTRQVLAQGEQRKACGIVTLDLSLITTLIGAVCTNLVIMIKFASE
uniref:Gustatory receptor n=1 Tax=Anopheles dirus TaxID=7168 RepID=A0A182NZ01_9DIPT